MKSAPVCSRMYSKHRSRQRCSKNAWKCFRQNQGILGARLNQLLHRDPDARLGSVPDVEPSPMPFTLEQMYAAAEEANPILDSRRIMVDRSATRLDLARKEHLPDFNFKVGYVQRGQFDDLWDISVSAEIPLFFWRKEQRGVEEASAELGESMNQFETVAQDLFRQVKQEYLKWTTAERLQSLYGDALIPQASLTLEVIVVRLSGGQPRPADGLEQLGDSLGFRVRVLRSGGRP